jgi:hypothetical protein
MGRSGPFVVLLSLLAAAPARADDPAPTDRRTQIEAAVTAEQFGTAVVLCGEALKADAPDLELRGLCAKALVGLGDRLKAAGSPANARVRWEEAATVDPRLMDDPEFVQRLAGLPKALPEGPGTTKEPDPPRNTQIRRPAPRPRPAPVEVKAEPRVQGPDDGPRWDLGFGLGLSFGFDGLASVTMSWLTDQRYLVEVALGLIYPSADVRFRWFGLTNCITPYVGVGLFVPFGSTDRLGLDLSSYESLYELGESLHIDIGLAYMPVIGLDLTAGISFVTPFDQDHPDTVLFFPQVSAGATWRF